MTSATAALPITLTPRLMRVLILSLLLAAVSWSKEVCNVMGHALVILHQAGVEPRQHLVPLALPFREVVRAAEAALGNVGAGLLQGKGEVAQFFGRSL